MINVNPQTVEDLENIQEISVSYIGQTLRDNWKCDEWRVSINNTWVTSYFTGLGHRKSVKGAPPKPKMFGGVKTLAVEAWENQYLRPFAPKKADVLHSLILDGDAVDMCFEDWASELGMNVDSRKDHVTYEQCVQTGLQLRKHFKRSTLEKIRELLQDY